LLPDSAASKYNIDTAKLKDLKKRHARVKKLFRGLQGKEANLKKAILKGAKQKSSDFSLKGTNGIIAELQGLEAIGELAQLGDLGVVATAASVGAASGILATIKSWLNPVKDIFNKFKGKAAVKKLARLMEKGKEISPELRQRAEQYQQQQAAQQQQQTNQEYSQNPTQPSIPNPTNYTPPQTNIPNTPSVPQQVPTSTARMPTITNSTKGMSKKAKIGIGIGVAALISAGAYFMFRSKPKTKSKPQKSSQKENLGKINFS